MRRISIGLIDYGIGNHASVKHCLNGLGFSVKISDRTQALDDVDVLLIPGVGAFPPAMKALIDRGLAAYLQTAVRKGRPLIGLCVGMQVLATRSFEHRETPGLDLIPGDISPFASGTPHIGWNSISCLKPDPLLQNSDGQSFYFNHSYLYRGKPEYQACVAENSETFAALIRKDNVVGIQFHPEKSQLAGKALLTELIRGMAYA
jgi:glutamine amidotransferase